MPTYFQKPENALKRAKGEGSMWGDSSRNVLVSSERVVYGDWFIT